MLRSVDRGAYTGDRDLGKMLLVFMLIEEVRLLCSMDDSNIRTEEN